MLNVVSTSVALLPHVHSDHTGAGCALARFGILARVCFSAAHTFYSRALCLLYCVGSFCVIGFILSIHVLCVCTTLIFSLYSGMHLRHRPTCKERAVKRAHPLHTCASRGVWSALKG